MSKTTFRVKYDSGRVVEGLSHDESFSLFKESNSQGDRCSVEPWPVAEYKAP